MITLSLLVAVALLSARTAIACNDRQFRCNDGQCIDLGQKCDGNQDCYQDGSDESPDTCNAANRTLAVGERLVARVDYQQAYDGVWFLLCDRIVHSCHLLQVGKYNHDGELSSWAYLDCNMEGKADGAFFPCTYHHGVWAKNAVTIPTGWLVFEITRSDAYFNVSLQGHPEHSVYIPADEDNDYLRIKPYWWTSYMRVDLRDVQTTTPAPTTSAPTTKGTKPPTEAPSTAKPPTQPTSSKPPTLSTTSEPSATTNHPQPSAGARGSHHLDAMFIFAPILLYILVNIPQ